MPEITTRLGPLRLSWQLDFTAVNGNVIEVFATLEGVSDDAMWRPRHNLVQWPRDSSDPKWRQLCDWVEETFADAIAASDAAREAIERERLDLQREDAERFAGR